MENKFKLGRNAKRQSKYALKLKDYIANLPQPPAVCDWSKVVLNWLMLGNDTVGDCTCAGALHLFMTWLYNNQKFTVFTTQQALDLYSAITGYNQTTGENDNGASLSDVMEYLYNTGFNNDKIAGFVEVDYTNISEIEQAIDLFGGIYIGVQLPDGFDANADLWDVTGDPNPQQGHCVIVNAYDDNAKLFTIVSWGRTYQVTFNWFNAYCDEAMAVLSQDWINQVTNDCPVGLDLKTLNTDLQALKIN